MSQQDDELFERVVNSGAQNAGGTPIAPITGVPARPIVQLGNVQAQGHGLAVTMPGAGGHVLTVGLAGATGAGIGAAASGTWRGAGIGAAANLGIVGAVNAAFGKGFTGTGGRVAYGILGAVGIATATWLIASRSRR